MGGRLARTERGHNTPPSPSSFRPGPLQSPHHDPPARRAATLRPQRAPARPRRRHRRRGAAAHPPDELHRLERRPPRLAGAALLAAARPGPDAAARRQRGLRLRRPRQHAVTERGLGSLAGDHGGGRPLARRRDGLCCFSPSDIRNRAGLTIATPSYSPNVRRSLSPVTIYCAPASMAAAITLSSVGSRVTATSRLPRAIVAYASSKPRTAIRSSLVME